MTARGARRKTPHSLGEEALLERLQEMTAQKDTGILSGKTLVERGILPVLATITTALVLAVAGALYAGLQSVRQIQDTRYTREDGATERRERVNGDQQLAGRLTNLTIQVTKIAEQKISNERAILRSEQKIDMLSVKMDDLRVELGKLTARHDDATYEPGRRE